MKYKYLVIAGEITSKNDGERHWIGTSKLCALYGVDPKECYRIDRPHFDQIPFDLTDLPVLAPRYDGNYSLPN